MKENNSMSQYLGYIRKENSLFIQQIKAYAKENHVPIIKDDMASLMAVLLQMAKPLRILEIGTAIGYSTILMMQALEEVVDISRVKVTTIERDDQMVNQARKNIHQSGYENQIHQIHGDATDVLQELCRKQEQYDFIFMDAAKGQYLTFLPDVLYLLKKQGTLVSDNVLQQGDVARSRFNVPRRRRTIHQRMRQYLWEINHHKQLSTTVLDIADGATISIKIQE